MRTGDLISLDVAARSLELEVPREELATRTPNQATLDGYASPPGAGNGSTSTTSTRPTAAPTSTSSWARPVRRSAVNPTDRQNDPNRSDRMPPRTALVTGGASGLGAAAAERLSADGLKVTTLDLAGPTSAPTSPTRRP
ncbi:hypothetical protein GCM10029992_47460 [Glycomyces albus]